MVICIILDWIELRCFSLYLFATSNAFCRICSVYDFSVKITGIIFFLVLPGCIYMMKAIYMYSSRQNFQKWSCSKFLVAKIMSCLLEHRWLFVFFLVVVSWVTGLSWAVKLLTNILQNLSVLWNILKSVTQIS